MLPLVLALLAAPAPQQVLDRLSAAGPSYVALRDELLADGDLMAKLEGASFGSWKARVHAEIMLAHRAHPELSAPLARPSSLIPSQYLLNQSRRPNPYRSLGRIPADATPLLFELWFHADAMGSFSRPEDFPANVSAEERERLMAEERSALSVSILNLVAERKHPAAFDLALSVVEDPRALPALRQAATRALGKSGSPRALTKLSSMLGDRDLADSAIAGLGDLGAPAFDRLAAIDDRSVQISALRALGGIALRTGSAVSPTQRAALIRAIERASADPAAADAVVEITSELEKHDASLKARLPEALRARVDRRLSWSARRL